MQQRTLRPPSRRRRHVVERRAEGPVICGRLASVWAGPLLVLALLGLCRLMRAELRITSHVGSCAHITPLSVLTGQPSSSPQPSVASALPPPLPAM
jgi:hypothetical protein